MKHAEEHRMKSGYASHCEACESEVGGTVQVELSGWEVRVDAEHFPPRAAPPPHLPGMIAVHVLEAAGPSCSQGDAARLRTRYDVHVGGDW